MGKLMDESDFNPDVARARREQVQRQLDAATAPTPDTVTEEH